MRHANAITLLCLFLLAGGLWAWFREPTHLWHQRISATVLTPAGEARASVVQRGHLIDRSRALLPEARGASSGLRGEGLVLEVTPGRFLFVLLDDSLKPFPVFFPKEAPLNAVHRLTPPLGPAAIPPALYPPMVTFDDLARPDTVRAVDPADLAATFGPGVTLVSLTMEITDAPLTTGAMASVLPWLPDYRAKNWHLNGKRCIACPVKSDHLADLIHAGEFIAMPR
jgi:hypothetical protein